MNFKLLSVVVGTEACPASCPFCVSGVKPNRENLLPPQVNWRNLKIAGNLANRSNVDTVMLTSRGEPTFFPEQITEYLQHLKEFNFPFIELQTNGLLIARNKKFYKKHLQDWYENGLTTITISVVSFRPEVNQRIYAPESKYIDLPDLIKFIHSIGISVRLTCVCCKDLTGTPKEISEFIKFAQENKVEQVTLRPVNDEFRRKSAKIWVSENKLSANDKQQIKNYLDNNGTKLLELDRIGIIYDVDGQNVCLSLPLNKNIRDTNPDNGRQLIFFPDGHIRYEWEMTGGILL